ncbi:hypothetical protein HCN44_006001 [Aphidius gifuensis]|uniref:Uncharacterized protein n=1 Tax=Aphidius gifuensis TaxID=684658 RepID=A0A835CYA3_APHGI|nr:hypothetical protein HCN44_006001 [Aphidius gifuensis]
MKIYIQTFRVTKTRSISESQTTEAVSSDPTEPVQESRSSAALSSLDLVPPITKDQQHTKILENHSTEPIIQSEQSHCNDLLKLLSSFKITKEFVQSLEVLVSLLKIQLELQMTCDEKIQETKTIEKNVPDWKIGGAGKVKLVDDIECWMSSALLDVIKYDLYDNPNGMTRQLIISLIGNENLGFVLKNSCLKEKKYEDNQLSGNSEDDNENQLDNHHGVHTERKSRTSILKKPKRLAKRNKFQFNRVKPLKKISDQSPLAGPHASRSELPKSSEPSHSLLLGSSSPMDASTPSCSPAHQSSLAGPHAPRSELPKSSVPSHSLPLGSSSPMDVSTPSCSPAHQSPLAGPHAPRSELPKSSVPSHSLPLGSSSPMDASTPSCSPAHQSPLAGPHAPRSELPKSSVPSHSLPLGSSSPMDVSTPSCSPAHQSPLAGPHAPRSELPKSSVPSHSLPLGSSSPMDASTPSCSPAHQSPLAGPHAPRSELPISSKTKICF